MTRRARQSGIAAPLRAIVCVIGLGLLLAGCDKCGDFPWPWRSSVEACRDQAPPRPY